MANKNFKDLTGKRFERLYVIKVTNIRGKNRGVIYECLCDCGKTCFASGNRLRVGDTRSCGCLRTELSQNGMKKARKSSLYYEGTEISLIKSKKAYTNNRTGVRGVSFTDNKYRADITFKGKTHYLGRYEKLDDAARARKEAEAKLHDDFVDWYYSKYPEKRKI